MRLKAIPQQVIGAVKTHPAIIAGVGVAMAGTFYVYKKQKTNAANNAPDSLVRQAPVDMTTGASQQLNSALAAIAALVGGVSSGNGGGSSTSNGAVTLGTTPVNSNVTTPTISQPSTGGSSGLSTPTIDPATMILLSNQTLQINDNFIAQMAQLQLAAAISASNAWIANATVNSNNYAISAGLASSFLNSDKQASVFSLSTGVPGGNISFNGVNFENSNKNGWDSNLAAYINNGTLANAVSMIGATQPNASFGGTSGGIDQNHNPVPAVHPFTGAPSGVSSTMPNFFAPFTGSLPSPQPQQNTTVLGPAQQQMTSIPSAANANIPTVYQPPLSTPISLSTPSSSTIQRAVKSVRQSSY